METHIPAPAIARRPVDPNCPKCRQWVDGPEVYSVTRFTDNAILVWDIELARHICSDGRMPVEISPEWLDELLRVNEVTLRHLDHVDPTVPGIACAFGYVGQTPLLGLIDGSHGASRCRDGLRFHAHLLNESESLQCQRVARKRFVEFMSLLDSAPLGKS